MQAQRSGSNQSPPAGDARDAAGRYRENYLSEREGVYLYTQLAEAESDTHLQELYRKIAAMEDRHSATWRDLLMQAGAPVPTYTPGWRPRMLAWLARRLGTGAILPIISGMEARAVHEYDNQPEAVSAGMPQQERSHARLFRYLKSTTRGGIAGPLLAQFEGRHRATGGNELRAAVLGASDGLTSNTSLVMGVAGATLVGNTVLLTGIAGLLAGALSMAIGEWVSVQSARELNMYQIETERQELATAPEEEAEELALIYESKGVDPETAKNIASNLLKQPASALDTLAREELGVDPKELGGSAWSAAITSFLLFCLGAVIPVIPFIFGGGLTAVIVSLAFSLVGFVAIGAGVSLTTGVPLLSSCTRQVILGFVAACITFGLGKLVGAAIG